MIPRAGAKPPAPYRVWAMSTGEAGTHRQALGLAHAVSPGAEARVIQIPRPLAALSPALFSRVYGSRCIWRPYGRAELIPSLVICTSVPGRADNPSVAPLETSSIDCSSWLSTSSVGTSSTTPNSGRSRKRQEEGPVEAVGAAAVGGVQGTCGKPRPFAVSHQARPLP